MAIANLHARTTLRGHPPALTEYIRARCTVPNPKYADILRYSPTGGRYTKVPSHFYLSEGGDAEIAFPRGLNVFDRLDAETLKITYPGTNKRCKFPALQVQPNDIQQEFLQAIQTPSYRDITGTYLFVSPPGSGKTISGLLAAVKWGLKTLVLVDREVILATWQKDIAKAFGGAVKPGLIRGPTFRIGDQITLAMTQTLKRRESMWGDLWKEIGTLLVDECDLVPAPMFFDVIAKCPARYRLGITGSERRKDGLHSVMYLLFGKPVHRVADQVTDTMVPVSRVIEVTTKFETARTLQEQLDEMPEDPVALDEALVHDADRNNLIAKNVIDSLDQGRTCLVSVSRREHAYQLLAAIYARRASVESSASPEILLGAGRDENSRILRSILKGKTKLTISTISYIKRGADLPPLDCLHLAGPIASQTNVRQLIGRVRRKSIATGKTDAWIYDYIDTKCPILHSQFRRARVPEYRNLGITKYKNTYYA